jgi:hypothetical protein
MPIQLRRAAVWLAALLAAMLTLFSGTLLTQSATAAGGATITVLTPGVLTNGETISVSGNAGGPNAPALYVAVCETTPTASNCDQSLAGFGTSTAHIQQVTPDPVSGAWGPVNFYVRSTLATGNTPTGYDCATQHTRVIGTTNSLNPADHTYDSTQLLNFGSAPTTSPAPTPTTPTPTPTSTAPSSTSAAPSTTASSTSAAPSTTASSTSAAPSTTASSTSAAPNGPTLQLSTSTIYPGQQITVTGSKFPLKATTLYVSVCKNPPSATSCDVTIGDFAIVDYTGTGSFTTTLNVHTTFKSGDGAIDCSAVACVVGTTNGMNPADQTYNATAPFTVVAAPAGATSAGATTSGGSGVEAINAAQSSNQGTGALASTGARNVPTLVLLALSLLVGGLVLLLGGVARPGFAQRRRH